MQKTILISGASSPVQSFPHFTRNDVPAIIEAMPAQIQTTEDQFFAEIQAAGRNGGSPALSYLWRLYLTFNRLRKRGYQVRLVGHYRQARLVIEGGLQ